MNPLDQMIAILNRVKNCDKALSNLIQARDNALWKDNVYNEKYANHIYSLICEAIKIIEDRENL